MPRLPVEQLITQWIYNDYYQYKDKPLPGNVTNKYMKALLDVAGADGVLTDAERKWVVGFAATRGKSSFSCVKMKRKYWLFLFVFRSFTRRT
jgi:hypothetical protein